MLKSGRALMMSSTFERALARSVLSSRFSTTSIFLGAFAIASSMPFMRCVALSAPIMPTKAAILPPFGKSLTISSPRILPAS